MQRFFALCALALNLFLSGPAEAALQTPPLVLLEGTEWPLRGHVAYWRDPTGTASVNDVARKPPEDFTHLQNKLSLGFTADAVWLRFTVDFGNPARRTGDVWLELSQNVMEDARLFVPTPEGTYIQAIATQQASSSAQRLEHRLPVFAIPVASGSATYYLRLATSTSMSSKLTLWEPRALMKDSTTESFVWGWVFGAYMLVVFFYFFFWLWTREPIHLIYTSYVAINCMAAIFTGGWPSQFFPEVPMPVWLKWLGTWISLSVVVGVWFTVKFLKLELRWPRMAKTSMAVVSVICLIGVVGVLTGHYRNVIPPIQLTSVATILLTLVVSVRLVREGSQEAKFFLFAFSFFYIGVTWRYLRNFGLMEPSFWNDNSYQIGAFIHMLVMSTGIFANYSRLRREKETAEARALTEASLREEQRDFVGMVSHELRTPLSIIAASAENLSHDADLSTKSRQRVDKISRATERMAQLMENYLAKERMLLDTQRLQLKPVDLTLLCRQAGRELEELDAPPVEIQTTGTPAQAQCDPDLLKIALHNLLINALRHSPPGGRITISVASLLRSVEIRVTDQGSGIPEEEVEHIFTRFYRGRGALDQPGAGLGLYLVRTIIERHGGKVSARNLPGRGCEFCLELPQ